MKLFNLSFKEASFELRAMMTSLPVNIDAIAESFEIKTKHNHIVWAPETISGKKFYGPDKMLVKINDEVTEVEHRWLTAKAVAILLTSRTLLHDVIPIPLDSVMDECADWLLTPFKAPPFTRYYPSSPDGLMTDEQVNDLAIMANVSPELIRRRWGELG